MLGYGDELRDYARTDEWLEREYGVWYVLLWNLSGIAVLRN